MNDPALLMRLGVNSEVLPGDASDPAPAGAGDIAPSKSKKIANKSALSMQDHSHGTHAAKMCLFIFPRADVTTICI